MEADKKGKKRRRQRNVVVKETGLLSFLGRQRKCAWTSGIGNDKAFLRDGARSMTGTRHTHTHQKKDQRKEKRPDKMTDDQQPCLKKSSVQYQQRELIALDIGNAYNKGTKRLNLE